jgi:hypothetical protein
MEEPVMMAHLADISSRLHAIITRLARAFGLLGLDVKFVPHDMKIAIEVALASRVACAVSTMPSGL